MGRLGVGARRVGRTGGLVIAGLLGLAEAGGGGPPTSAPYVLNVRLYDNFYGETEPTPWNVAGTVVQAFIGGELAGQPVGARIGPATAVKGAALRVTLPAHLDNAQLTDVGALNLFRERGAADCRTNEYRVSDPQARAAVVTLRATYREGTELQTSDLAMWMDEYVSSSSSLSESRSGVWSLLIYADRPTTVRYRARCSHDEPQSEFIYTKTAAYDLDVQLRRGWNTLAASIVAGSARDARDYTLKLRNASPRGYWAPLPGLSAEPAWP